MKSGVYPGNEPKKKRAAAVLDYFNGYGRPKILAGAGGCLDTIWVKFAPNDVQCRGKILVLYIECYGGIEVI